MNNEASRSLLQVLQDQEADIDYMAIRELTMFYKTLLEEKYVRLSLTLWPSYANFCYNNQFEHQQVNGRHLSQSLLWGCREMTTGVPSRWKHV